MIDQQFSHNNLEHQITVKIDCTVHSNPASQVTSLAFHYLAAMISKSNDRLGNDKEKFLDKTGPWPTPCHPAQQHTNVLC